MRVMSRKPPAASRSSVRCSSPSPVGDVHQRRRRELRHVAHERDERVVVLGRDRDASAPSVRTSPRTARGTPRGRCRPVGVSTHVAPTNRSASAPSTPSCSEPAIGWPPTKRADASGRAASTVGDDRRLHRPDVGDEPPRRRRARRPRRSATRPDRHRDDHEVGAGDRVGERRRRPRRPRRARCARRPRLGSRSKPTHVDARARASARPIEPPIRPVPTTRDPGRTVPQSGVALLREVVAERARALEVHVVQLVARAARCSSASSTRMQRRHAVVDRRAPGRTSSGTSPRPSARAAVAGNSAVRSSVAVKMMLTRSSCVDRRCVRASPRRAAASWRRSRPSCPRRTWSRPAAPGVSRERQVSPGASRPPVPTGRPTGAPPRTARAPRRRERAATRPARGAGR